MKKIKRVSLLLFALIVLSVAPVSAQGIKSRYAQLDKARVHYQSFGKGHDALVLVHGWGCNLDHWRDQITEFSKQNRVIALDLPGHGLSDKPQISYNMDLFATAIEAVMKDAKVERAVLAGHSMGTPVVRQFYRKYPQMTLGIIIVDGGLRLFGDKAMRDQWMTSFRAPNYKEMGARMIDSMSGALQAPEKQRIWSSFDSTPQHVLVSAMEAMNLDSLYGPDKMNVPVLAILAKSPFWAPDTEQFLHSLAPDLEFQMWEGVSHFLMMEKPSQFNAAVLAFLKKKALLKSNT